MNTSNKNVLPTLAILFLMILALPLLYLLVSRVLLPMAWNEPQFDGQEHAEELTVEPEQATR